MATVFDVSRLETATAFSEVEMEELRLYLASRKAPELTALLPQVFAPVYRSLQETQGLQRFRISVCETLTLWMARAIQGCRSDPSLGAVLESTVNASQLDYVFHYAIDFHTSAPSAVRDMVTKLILFKKTVLQSPTTTFCLWLDHAITTVSVSTSVLYLMVELLVKETGATYLLQTHPTFVSFAVTTMAYPAMAPPCGRAIAAIYRNQLAEMDLQDKEQAAREWTALWLKTLATSLLDEKLLGPLLTYLLPSLFKLSGTGFRVFVSSLDIVDEADIRLVMGCVRIGQVLALVNEPFYGEDALLSLEQLREWMTHQSPELRIGAFGVLTTSAKGTQPVLEEVFDVLRYTLDGYFLEADASFRSRFMSLLRVFIARVRDSCYAMNRNLVKGRDAERLGETIAASKAFLTWLADTAYAQLRPGSSIQRLDSGFKVVLLLLQAGIDTRVDRKHYEKGHQNCPFMVDLYSPTAVRLLVDNVANEFHAIRDQAMAVLRMCPSGVLKESELHLMARHALTQLGAVRGRNADSNARILVFVFGLSCSLVLMEELIDALGAAVKAAKTDLVTAAYTESLHGYYTALTGILETYSFDCEMDAKLQEAVETVFTVWGLTQPLMVQEALHQNLEALAEALTTSDEPLSRGYGSSEQVLMGYAWRAVKEGAGLMRVMLERAPARVMPTVLVERLGSMLVDQLRLIRHPGAFAAVYPTFVACCVRCTALGVDPQRWLAESLAAILTTAALITRRSGGIPFIIAGVLIANPLLVEVAFTKLFAIASVPVDETKEEKNDIPQVHAFNCLNHLFVESALAEACSSQVDAALALALPAFASQNWSTRNCAVMLFTAMQNRIFGSNRVGSGLSRVPARQFFARFSTVRSTLLTQFAASVRDLERASAVETVFPLLSLISRLETTGDDMEAFVPWLHRCLGNPQWKVREMAAFAYPAVVAPTAVFTVCMELLSEASTSKQNRLHGTLLSVQALLRNAQASYDIEPPKALVTCLYNLVEPLVITNRCESTAKAYLNLIQLVGGVVPPVVVTTLRGYFLHQHDIPPARQGPKMALLADLGLFLLNHNLECSSRATDLGDLLRLTLRSPYHAVQTSAILFVEAHVSELDDSTRGAVEEALWGLLEDDSWSYVQAQALGLVPRFTPASLNRVKVLMGFTRGAEDVRASALQALGPFVAYEMASDASVFEPWLALVHSESADHKPFSSRLAALRSLMALTGSNVPTAQLARIHFALYGFLSDEDEDLRNASANALAPLYGIHPSPLPSVVEAIFVKTFPTRFGDWAVPVVNQKHEEAVAATMKKTVEALNPDEAIFRVEKDNLYRNELQQRHYLNQMVEALVSTGTPLAVALGRDLIPAVRAEVLAVVAMAHRLGPDGPNGWAKDEIPFSAVMEAIFDIAMTGNSNLRLMINPITLDGIHHLLAEAITQLNLRCL